MSGCGFDQQSFPLRRGDVVRLEGVSPSETPTTRAWLRAAHEHLEPLLTRQDPRDARALLTEELTENRGRARDVYAWFRRNPDTLVNLVLNFSGIRHTAQVAGRDEAVDLAASQWPGFEQVWIPINPSLALSGRLGLARRDGEILHAPCVIILPGLFGDNGVVRMRDVAMALREQGIHALALEMRGHGQTERRYPDIYYTFGVLETRDLLVVSDWLEDEVPGVTSTGIAGYCWGGNLALLAAWYDGCGGQHPSIIPSVAAHLDPLPERRRFRAGVMAFSPVLRWEEIVDLCDREQNAWLNPLAYYFQETLRRRMIAKAHPNISGKLRDLIAFEFARSEFGPSFEVVPSYRFLRFLPYGPRPADDKLESVRIPVVMMAAVNDPFIPAQDVADMIAQTDNPNVAAIILRGGGHIGFVADNRRYFYSMLINFFSRSAPDENLTGSSPQHAPI